MVNRRGFIRIAELLIALSVLTIVLIIVYKQGVSKQETNDLGELGRDILADVGLRENLRSEIVSGQDRRMTETNEFINLRLPEYIQFELRACKISSACGQSNYKGNVYSAERIISVDKNTFNPVKLRLFLWVEE